MRYGPALATVTVTWNSKLSKNARIANRFKGFYIKADAKEAEAVLEAELTKALKGVRIYTNKVYIDLMVYKPRTNIDAINFVDAVADVLKRVIQVDDKWYSIKSVDWELDKVNPRMVIRLFQPERRHAK